MTTLGAQIISSIPFRQARSNYRFMTMELEQFAGSFDLIFHIVAHTRNYFRQVNVT